MTTKTDDMIRKIEGLLRKAESTTNDHERDAFMSKADELILQYEIDNAQLFINEGRKEKPILIELLLRNPYQESKYILLREISQSCNCRLILSRRHETDRSARYYKIVGFESDIAMCRILFSSLLIQCMMSMNKNLHLRQEYESMQYWKKSYYQAFAETVGKRLIENRKASIENNSNASDYLPVFVERKDEVNQAVLDLIPNLRYGRGITPANSQGARMAGANAANKANIGQRGIGSRKQIGR